MTTGPNNPTAATTHPYFPATNDWSGAINVYAQDAVLADVGGVSSARR